MFSYWFLLCSSASKGLVLISWKSCNSSKTLAEVLVINLCKQTWQSLQAQLGWTSLIVNIVFAGWFRYLYLILCVMIGMCKVCTVIAKVMWTPTVGVIQRGSLKAPQGSSHSDSLSPLSVQKSCKDQSFKCLNEVLKVRQCENFIVHYWCFGTACLKWAWSNCETSCHKAVQHLGITRSLSWVSLKELLLNAL